MTSIYKYQRICAPVEDDPETLVPKRRTRHCQYFSFFIVVVVSAITALYILIYGNCDCFVTGDFINETKTNSSSRQTSSEFQIDRIRFFLIVVSVFAGLWTFARFTYLVVLLCEELKHRKQCHKGSIRKTIGFVFTFSGEKMWYGGGAVWIITVMMHLYMFKCYYVPFCDLIVVPLIIFYLILFIIFNCQEPTRIKQVLYTETASAKMGGSFAIWFYVGYLKLILCPNDDKPSIKQRIQEYKAKHQLGANILFPEKLFILFPTSCYTYKNLANADSKRIRQRQQLEGLVIERSGITERTFNNSVYCINDKPQKEHHEVTDSNTDTDKKYLVAVEYATPLDTLYNLSVRGTAIHLSREEKRDVMLRFYGELKMLLQNDHACYDTYVLVLYDDEEAEDRTSCMSNALMKKIKETLNAENK